MEKHSFTIDEKSEEELEELAEWEGKSRSAVVRESIQEHYLKEKRARKEREVFLDLYREGVITKDVLLLLLPKEDAESIIIGVDAGTEAAEHVRNRGG